MLVRLYNENPNPREIRKIVDILRDGGVIIYPTDTVYGLGCDITNHLVPESIKDNISYLTENKYVQHSFINPPALWFSKYLLYPHIARQAYGAYFSRRIN